MVYSFARVGATVTMRVGDYFQHRKRLWLRLHEKGGKRHEVPCHPSLEEFLSVWVAAAGIGRDKKGPLFRSMSKGDKLTDNPMTRFDVLHMIKRRAQAAGLPYSTCCHTFRATGITRTLMLIRLFQLTARGSVAECLVRPFPGLFASFSFSSPTKRPARSTWPRAAGPRATSAPDARTIAVTRWWDEDAGSAPPVVTKCP